jgi:hypothetical protein
MTTSPRPPSAPALASSSTPYFPSTPTKAPSHLHDPHERHLWADSGRGSRHRLPGREPHILTPTPYRPRALSQARYGHPTPPPALCQGVPKQVLRSSVECSTTTSQPPVTRPPATRQLPSEPEQHPATSRSCKAFWASPTFSTSPSQTTPKKQSAFSWSPAAAQPSTSSKLLSTSQQHPSHTFVLYADASSFVLSTVLFQHCTDHATLRFFKAQPFFLSSRQIRWPDFL